MNISSIGIWIILTPFDWDIGLRFRNNIASILFGPFTLAISFVPLK